MKILLCVFSLFALLSCGQMAEGDVSAIAPPDVVMETIADETAAASVEEIKAVGEKAPLQSASIDRKLIKNGSLSFEVKDVHSANTQITMMTLEAGGYIASEKQQNNDEHPRYEQVVRIPGDKLDEFVAKVEALAARVEDKNFSTQDVTEEFVDLQGRLTAKKEVEARYREIVKQAKTVREILEVEDQIGNVRAEIETIQGRLKYLSNRVSYSTVTLTYYEHYSIAVPGTGSKFAQSFFGGWNALVAFLIAVTATWPFLIIISAITWLVIRLKRKGNKELIQPQ